MNNTFGAPSRARLGAGHAGLDTSKVRPITPENAWPDLYSFSAIDRPPSLPRHRHPQTFFWRDPVVFVQRGPVDVELDPGHLAGELVGVRTILLRHRRTGFQADVARLVGRKHERLGSLDPAGAVLPAVEIERDVPAPAETAAVVGEFHTHLVRSGRKRLRALDIEVSEPEEVIAVLQLPTLGVQAPPAREAALSH